MLPWSRGKWANQCVGQCQTASRTRSRRGMRLSQGQRPLAYRMNSHRGSARHRFDLRSPRLALHRSIVTDYHSRRPNRDRLSLRIYGTLVHRCSTFMLCFFYKHGRHLSLSRRLIGASNCIDE